MPAQFIDISVFNPQQIDWRAYKAWSASNDGISRVAMRSSYGVGYIDQHFAAYREGALSAGIDVIIYYHYAYPQYNANPANEANYQHSVVGSIRAQDLVILDFEENVDQATGNWAYEWLATQEANYGKLPGIYASSAYIASRLQDQRLQKYPLWLANWQFTPDERPSVPDPWASYEFVQYSDKATNIPGVSGNVDANIFLGGNTLMSTTIPSGWSDDGATLKGPNGIPVVLGFRDYVLKNNWNKDNWPLEPEQHCDPLEQSNTSLGAGQRQRFRWVTLGYTAKMGIFEAWTGPELLWYQQKLAQITQEIVALKANIGASNLQQINALVKQFVALSGQLDALSKV